MKIQRPKFMHVFFLGLGLLLLRLAAPVQAGEQVWNFDRDSPGRPPTGFTSALTGQGTPGAWVVLSDPSAASPPNVLAQTSADNTDYRFPLALADGTSYKDFVVHVKFKTISGTVDQSAGLVFRVQDKDNYYVVRANALENNFRFYHVVKGRRVQFAGASLKVSPQAWHEIKVEARGNEFRCYFDGQLQITATDTTFQSAGQIGLWTKADSVIYFDGLTVRDATEVTSSAAATWIFAQKLVDDLVARHPGLVRIGLHVTPPNDSQNLIIASNVPARIGRRSDPEDLEAMRSGQPVLLKEGENVDVTLPLHDAGGKIIGAIGLTFKPKPDGKEGDAIRRARDLVGELETQISFKAILFASSR